jgi:hypothetical protein
LSFALFIGYFFCSAYLSFSKVEGTSIELIDFPHFYLAIFLVFALPYLFGKASKFIAASFYDDPVNLLIKYRNVYNVIIKGT